MSATTKFSPQSRNIRQIVEKVGSPYKACGTSSLWVSTNNNFAPPRYGNKVQAFTTGKDYFAELIKCFDAAQKEILIAGWQVNWDAQLAPGVRLYDVLLRIARKGTVIIRVMPWNDSHPVQTYDDETQYVLESINQQVGIKDIVQVHLSSELPDESASFFSHHQKMVAIDQKIAFVGGMDLAYGRYDDETYSLKSDDEGRNGLNRYNPCIPHLGKMAEAQLVDPALLKGAWDNVTSNASDTLDKINKGAFQSETESYLLYGTATDSTIDPQRQPRMPWQDVHFKIEGASVVDLQANFALRWNIKQNSARKMPIPARPKPDPSIAGQSVQVLRSAPLALREEEYKSVKAQSVAGYAAPDEHQDDIHRAMRNLIDNAQHYIYIENQFFVSACGIEGPLPDSRLSGPSAKSIEGNLSKVQATRIIGGDSKQRPSNDICERLANRIAHFIHDRARPPFHVYIVLPVHPEGMLNDGSIMSQIYNTMQSLAFGSNSLINRIKRELQQAGRDESEWTQYLTLLNLRNWACLGQDRYVTEQIYVHSKLMIIDDRFVLAGSANINDRSLSGKRDSELAVLVADDEGGKADLCGNGEPMAVRSFAQALRKKMWRKLFSLDLAGQAAHGGVSPATELESVLDSPASPATWTAIQKLAEENTRLYEQVFDWIPRSFIDMKTESGSKSKSPASIWPRWREASESNKKAGPIDDMPFQNTFWSKSQAKNPSALKNIKGFIVALPINWTDGENNNWGYHGALIGQNDQVKTNNNPDIYKLMHGRNAEGEV